MTKIPSTGRAFDDPIEVPRGRQLVTLQGRQDFSSARTGYLSVEINSLT
jgi:hypothetical protein